MSKTRDEFLSTYWTRYPEMPARALRWGRVQQHYLGTQSVSDWHLVNLNSDASGADKKFKGSEVLVDGDLIALMPQNQIVLLAPNLTLRKAKDAMWAEHKKWQDFISAVREVFLEKSFQEVKTPSLVVCPGTEPSLEVFRTEFKLESKSMTFFLPTSPELNIKKLIAEGAEKVFEIAPVFRNGEFTERHHPEFLMLEWYRAFSNPAKIKMDVMDLVDILADKLKMPKPSGILTYSIPELFKTHCGFDLKPETTTDELKALAEKLQIDVSAANCIDDYFYLIFMAKIEFNWPKDHLVFVEKYPPYQAALARIGKDGWAERFEFYWQGLEIGNAFHELNDPDLQFKRAREDNERKLDFGKTEVPLDPAFFSALKFGMPPTAGIAVGMERLFMAMTGKTNISEFKQIYNISDI